MPFSPLRRRLLQGAGLGLVFAGSALGWRSYRNGVFAGASGSAFAAWSGFPPRAPVGMRPLVHAGILAGSPHNTQPWQFDITQDYIDVYADPRRALGPIDPHFREIFIALGGTIENMVIAATAFGMAPSVVVAPGTLGGTAPAELLAARILLGPGEAKASPLVEAMARRHTNRGPFDPDRPLPLSTITEWSRLREGGAELTFVTNAAERARLGLIIADATRTFAADAELTGASHRWLRTDWGEVQAYRDGLTVDGFGLSPPLAAALKILPAPSFETANRAWIDATENVHVATAAAFGAVTVQDLRDRAQTLDAGRLWQRLHLSATMAGIALHPLSQPIEIAERDAFLGRGDTMAKAMAEVLGIRGRRPTMLFRAGYASRPGRPSPRRDLEEVIMPRRSL